MAQCTCTSTPDPLLRILMRPLNFSVSRKLRLSNTVLSKRLLGANPRKLATVDGYTVVVQNHGCSVFLRRPVNYTLPEFRCRRVVVRELISPRLDWPLYGHFRPKTTEAYGDTTIIATNYRYLPVNNDSFRRNCI